LISFGDVAKILIPLIGSNRVISSIDMNELRRARRDFKVQASRYPDLALTRYYMDHRLLTPEMDLKSPDHMISLWQYVGTASEERGGDVLGALQLSKYGLLGGSLSAFAVIHGAKLDLFKRIAARAGSLTVVSDFVSARLITSLRTHFDVPAVLGKNLFVYNSNSMAVWINMVLFCLAEFQSKRMEPTTLPVDPFAASLTACDYLLETLRDPGELAAPETLQQRIRWDETWHRLREWTNGQGPSERLAAQILLSEGYQNLDPSHPLGGPDGGKDATCAKDGTLWVMAVYFPRGQKQFATIKNKFVNDLRSAAKHAPAFVFVTNQELTNDQKTKLQRAAGTARVELFHLERITAILDRPGMASVRRQFLSID